MVAWLTIDKILAVTTFHFFAVVVVKISRFRLAIVTVIVWGLGYILGGFFFTMYTLKSTFELDKKILYISLDFKNHFFFTYCWYIHRGFFSFQKGGVRAVDWSDLTCGLKRRSLFWRFLSPSGYSCYFRLWSL